MEDVALDDQTELHAHASGSGHFLADNGCSGLITQSLDHQPGLRRSQFDMSCGNGVFSIDFSLRKTVNRGQQTLPASFPDERISRQLPVINTAMALDGVQLEQGQGLAALALYRLLANPEDQTTSAFFPKIMMVFLSSLMSLLAQAGFLSCSRIRPSTIFRRSAHGCLLLLDSDRFPFT